MSNQTASIVGFELNGGADDSPCGFRAKRHRGEAMSSIETGRKAEDAPVELAAAPPRDPLSRLDRLATMYLRRSMARLDPEAGPVVSFTFDDVPDNAVLNGARILSEHGYKGTFYLSGGLCGRRFGPWRFFRREDALSLVADGHEIGCHTFSHPVVDLLDRDQLKADLDRNLDWLAGLGVAPVSFAYPYGAVGFARKPLIASRFRSCRGVRRGVNIGRADLAQLDCIRLYDVELDRPALERLIAEAARPATWLIFYMHDVQDGPTPHGCSPGLFESAITLCRNAGYEILSMRDALDALVGPEVAKARHAVTNSP
jgi:peptidoglycan/xylan/chitin deacetylase (PgdA/CDA1 family)